jgi:hypothetical protein
MMRIRGASLALAVAILALAAVSAVDSASAQAAAVNSLFAPFAQRPAATLLYSLDSAEIDKNATN